MTKEGGLGEGSWGAVTNADPMPMINFETDSKSAIEQYMGSFATQKLLINEPLRRALGDPNYKIKPFVIPEVRTTAPQDSISGWISTDIGGALPGGLSGSSSSSFDLYGGGNDIWGKRDDFRFLHRSLDGNGTIETTVKTVEAIDVYTKSGIMLRDGLGDDAKFFMVSVFPSGEINVARRESAGGDAVGGITKQVKLPNIGLRVTRKGGMLTVECRTEGGAYETLANIKDFLPRRVEAGVISLSHSGSELAKVSYGDLNLRSGS